MRYKEALEASVYLALLASSFVVAGWLLARIMGGPP